jgi:hypothetical protein
MEPDREWSELSARLDPLRECPKAKGCHLGLHLTTYPTRYDVYYGHDFFFHESNCDKMVSKATEFVESRGRRAEKQ